MPDQTPTPARDPNAKLDRQTYRMLYEVEHDGDVSNAASACAKYGLCLAAAGDINEDAECVQVRITSRHPMTRDEFRAALKAAEDDPDGPIFN